MKYHGGFDVFISYRRVGGSPLANFVYSSLANRGYKVFIDARSIVAGSFDKALLSTIESTMNFVVILSESCLMHPIRTEDDWFHKEILYALEMDRNLIALSPHTFTFPGCDPKLGNETNSVISQLSRHHRIMYHHDNPDAAIDSLCQKLVLPPGRMIAVMNDEQICEYLTGAWKRDDGAYLTLDKHGTLRIAMKIEGFFGGLYSAVYGNELRGCWRIADRRLYMELLEAPDSWLGKFGDIAVKVVSTIILPKEGAKINEIGDGQFAYNHEGKDVRWKRI